VLEIEKIPDGDLVVAIDPTGWKVTDRGEWMREKWKRGWIKVHIVVDVKSKRLLGVEIIDERVVDHNQSVVRSLLDQAEKNSGGVAAVIGDGGFDTRATFNELDERGIVPVIKMRRNASTRSRGSPSRAKMVRERKRIGEDEWKKKYGYGMRWAAEGFFSGVKRVMGEGVKASSRAGMDRNVVTSQDDSHRVLRRRHAVGIMQAPDEVSNLAPSEQHDVEIEKGRALREKEEGCHPIPRFHPQFLDSALLS
jgi:hypothetical protein